MLVEPRAAEALLRFSPYPQLKSGRSISPTGKGTGECITIAPKGVPFLSDMHNNTHQCTRNESKACKQLIQMHNKAHCYWY